MTTNLPPLHMFDGDLADALEAFAAELAEVAGNTYKIELLDEAARRLRVDA